MARFSGNVGYVVETETSPGVWNPVSKVRKMRGDLISQHSSTRGSDKINDDISLNHRISVVGDAYAFSNYFNIRWVEIDGAKWKVTGVDVSKPRLTLTLGGIWNG